MRRFASSIALGSILSCGAYAMDDQVGENQFNQQKPLVNVEVPTPISTQTTTNAKESSSSSSSSSDQDEEGNNAHCDGEQGKSVRKFKNVKKQGSSSSSSSSSSSEEQR